MFKTFVSIHLVSTSQFLCHPESLVSCDSITVVRRPLWQAMHARWGVHIERPRVNSTLAILLANADSGIAGCLGCHGGTCPMPSCQVARRAEQCRSVPDDQLRCPRIVLVARHKTTHGGNSWSQGKFLQQGAQCSAQRMTAQSWLYSISARVHLSVYALSFEPICWVSKQIAKLCQQGPV